MSHTYSYDQGGGANNGDIVSIANNLNTGRTQSFTYDTLNRLATAQSAATSGTDCWGDSYGYDRYGNLLTMSVTKCTAQNLSVTVDGSNHIVGMSYDAAGNLTNDGTHTYTWDAENRLKNTAATNYKFDGDNLRVVKGTNELYWFSAATCRHPLFGRSTSTGAYTDEFVHFNGQAVGYRDDSAGQVYHIFNDHLGSGRVMTNATGVTQFEADNYPHGAQRVITSTKDLLLKFQGRQIDSESGLSNVRRMYSPSLARFLASPTASVPRKPSRRKAVPSPQSVNPGTLASSNPVAQPNSLISSLIGLFAPEPGTEGHEQCVYGTEYSFFYELCAYPGPPDPIDFFQDLSDRWKCHFTGRLHGRDVKTGICSYICFPEGVAVGGTASFVHIAQLIASCPKYYGVLTDKTACPDTFEATAPGDIVAKIRPDIIQDSCAGKPQ